MNVTAVESIEDGEQHQLFDTNDAEYSRGQVAPGPLALVQSVHDVLSDEITSMKRKRGKMSNVWKYYRFRDPGKTDFANGGRVQCILCG